MLEAHQRHTQPCPLPWSTVTSSATVGISWPLFLPICYGISEWHLSGLCDSLESWATLENLFPIDLIQLQYRKAPAALWAGLTCAGWFPRNMRGRDQHHCWVLLPFASSAWVLWSGAGHEAPPSQKCRSRKAWLEPQEFPRTPALSFYLEDEKSMSSVVIKLVV